MFKHLRYAAIVVLLLSADNVLHARMQVTTVLQRR